MIPPTQLTAEQSRQLDWLEARASSELSRAASPELRHALGRDVTDIGSAYVTTTARADVLGFNRVVGLGLDTPASPDAVNEIIAFYRCAGAARFFVQVHPLAQPPELPQFLEDAGFRPYNNWVKLYRGVEDGPSVETDLRLERIGPAEAERFVSIVTACFDWPKILQPMVAGLIGRPNWYHYLAYDGDTPVATAAFFVHGAYAWLDYASTQPTHRGHGAQSALVARRIRDARELGCRYLVVETAEQTPEREAPSYRNMRRVGFQVAYVRPNYILVLADTQK